VHRLVVDAGITAEWKQILAEAGIDVLIAEGTRVPAAVQA
jgi:predicted Fe-Mo cluster-binding NifX family protein